MNIRKIELKSSAWGEDTCYEIDVFLSFREKPIPLILATSYDGKMICDSVLEFFKSLFREAL